MENVRESLVLEIVVRTHDDATAMVRSVFVTAAPVEDDDTIFWDVGSRRVALECPLGNRVHLVFIARPSVADILRKYTERAAVVRQANELYLAYPARVIREIVNDERTGGREEFIAPALEAHCRSSSDIVLLLSANRATENDQLVLVTEAEFGEAGSAYRRKHLRVVV